ncbi:MAG: hypothetical protein LBQ87_03245 [Candidatus Fibromonas sp.]|jgi:hypothetical protein|nr:hypothetical protein [Candidatus Fibromonas sp.]
MKSVKLLFFLGTFLSSCSHWIVETETRIQVINKTDEEIYGLSVVSQKKELIVLVPDTVKQEKTSGVCENSWVGKFKFAIFVKNSPDSVYLGEHELKGGSVRAEITGERKAFKMVLR